MRQLSRAAGRRSSGASSSGADADHSEALAQPDSSGELRPLEPSFGMASMSSSLG